MKCREDHFQKRSFFCFVFPRSLEAYVLLSVFGTCPSIHPSITAWRRHPSAQYIDKILDEEMKGKIQRLIGLITSQMRNANVGRHPQLQRHFNSADCIFPVSLILHVGLPAFSA